MQYFKKAQWIWCSEAASVNAYAVFTQEFDYQANEKPAILRISADSQYFVRVNEKTIGLGQYADYPEYKVFDEYDVTSLLVEGRNTLKVIGYCTVTDSSVYRQGVPGVLYEITAGDDVIAFSAPGVPCAPHSRYVSGPIENITGQLGYTFDYDENGEPLPETEAIAVDGSMNLYPRPVKKLEIRPRIRSVLKSCGIWYDKIEGTPAWRMQHNPMAFRSLHELSNLRTRPSFPNEDGILFHAEEGDGIYLILDMEKETAGLLEIELKTETGCEVLIGWGEHLDDLRVRTYVGNRNFGARYITKPGRRRFTHPFKRLGMRYLQLFVRSRDVRLYYAGVWPTVYPLSSAPEFRTADRLHTRINEVCRETLVNCLHEHYEDCPWREQALYAMDSRNQMLCGYYAFGEYTMPRESIRLLALSLREDNLLELCAPARIKITIPSFSAMFVVQLQEYLLYSGDQDFAREMLPVAKAIVDGFLARRNADGLIPKWEGEQYWNFYEWQPYLEGYKTHPWDKEALRIDAPMNCFAALAISRLADLMNMLGEDGSSYEAAANALRKATHERFWDETKGLYYAFANSRDRWHGAQLTQALAVYSGVCPEAYIDRVLPYLVDDTLVPVTLAYSIFQFDALMKRPEKYSRWVFDHVADVWGSMLSQNATTFWETIIGADDFSDAGSLCHGWSAVPLYLYYAYAMGIRPTAPGFKVEEVKPVESGLYELSAKVLLPDGSIAKF